MKTLLVFILIGAPNSVLFAQITSEIQKEDLTPRHIVFKPTAETLDSTFQIQQLIKPNEWMNYPTDYEHVQWHGQIDWDYYQPITYDFSSIIWTFNACGDSYHENGILRSRCACNEDSLLHGKAVYWDEQGRISTVSHYWNGKQYSYKTYDEGKISELWNYTHQNGLQEKHGKHVEFTSNGKIVNNYRYGVLHGEEIEYVNGYKKRETLYDEGIILSSESRDINGILIHSEYRDQAGNNLGTWIDYNSRANQLIKQVHENGRLVLKQTFVDEKLTERHTYQNNNSSTKQIFYPNGSKQESWDIAASGSIIYKSWSPEGELLNDMETLQGKFLRNSISFNGLEKTFVTIEKSSDGFEYLRGLVTTGRDTIRELYALNQGNLLGSVIHSNYYTQVAGKSVKQGQWRVYNNNKLVEVVHYSNGQRNGSAVFFDTTNYEPMPYASGNFTANQKHGYWNYKNDTIHIECRYHLDTLTSEYKRYLREADTTFLSTSNTLPQQNREIHETLAPLISCNYKLGVLNYDLQTFYPNGSKHWLINYTNGIRRGSCIAYEQNGDRKYAAIMASNEVLKYWYVTKRKKNGKLKQKKDRKNDYTPSIDHLLPFSVYGEHLIEPAH